MKKFNKIKLILTALYIGMPLSTVLSNNNDAEAMMKVGSAANRLTSTIRPTILKPTIAPKPTNIPKVPQKFATNVNRSTSLPASTPKPTGIYQQVNSFNSGKISEKVKELNLSAQSPSSSSSPKTANKLNLNSEFKNKLSSIFSEGKSSLTIKKPTSTNKISPNNPEKKQLESLLGGGGSSSTSSTSSTQTQNKVFENNSPEIPPAPPLPTSKETLKPLSGASSIGELQTKPTEKKMISKTNSSPLQSNLIEELNKKLQSRKK